VTTVQAAAAESYAPRKVLLANGTVARVRSSTPEDRDALLELHRNASDNSIYLRFFAVNRSASEAFVDRVCAPSPTSWSLVAEHGGRVVGIATAAVDAPGTAEVAMLVDERLHGQGIGTLLLEHLAQWSLARGVSTFSAEVLAANVPMLRVFHDAGFEFVQQRDHEVLSMTMDIRPSAASLAASGRRERAAERRSLAPLLEPAGVCVLGVSRRRGGIGREVLENILAGGYGGTVTAVGRSGLDVPGVRCVSTVEEVPRDLDLAVLALPVEELEDAIRALGTRGTRTCVILTSGLGEASADGQRTEQRLADLARDFGMRVVGPNCFGVLSNLRDTRLNATFARAGALPGALAVGSQSGGVGVAILEASRARGSGIACFVSLGNKLDVSGNDLLSAWSEDPGIRAGALYLESFHNPRKFARVAAVFARHKPLLVAFGGTSSAGLRAGASHTAASATPTRALHALFKTAGVVPVDGVEDLVDTAALLTEQPLPRGPRLGILGNAGGLGILAADAAQRAALVVPELSARTRRALDSAAPGVASTANPVDLGAAAVPASYRAALEVLLSSGDVDAVLVLTAATAVTDLGGVGEAVSWVAAAEVDVPVLTVTAGGLLSPAGAATQFRSPEAAVGALAHATAYGSWRRANTAHAAGEAATAHAGPALGPAIGSVPAAGRPAAPVPDEGWLAATEAAALLGTVGGRVPAMATVHTVDDAEREAHRIGYPVVVKASAGEIVHKSDVRLVRTGLHDARDVRAAAGDLLAALGDGAPLLVQEQVSGPEIAIGLTRDERFGPLVMVASGGVNLDLWQDQVFLMTPLRRSEVRDALRSLRTWPLLDGFRGAARVDVDAVVDLVETVGRLGEQHPEVTELDLNPVVCTPGGPVCVDVKVRVPRTT
jgi:acyl-CoA synthetase (NDP forming)/GNAT superfamily N-acetyltransferase